MRMKGLGAGVWRWGRGRLYTDLSPTLSPPEWRVGKREIIYWPTAYTVTTRIRTVFAVAVSLTSLLFLWCSHNCSIIILWLKWDSFHGWWLCDCCIVLLTLCCCFLFSVVYEPAMTTTKLPLVGWLKFLKSRGGGGGISHEGVSK